MKTNKSLIKLKTCSHCGQVLLFNDQSVEIDGECVCMSCLNLYECCENCHELILTSEIYIDSNENRLCEVCNELRCEYCEEYPSYEYEITYYENNEKKIKIVRACTDCHDEKFVNCYECNALIEKENGLYTENGMVCGACANIFYSECHHCHEWFHNDTIRSDNNFTVCTRCFEEHYFRCDSCDHIIHNDSYQADGMCDECCGNDDNNDSVIYQHDYRPSFNYFKEENEETELYFGHEIEVITQNRIRNDKAAGNVLEEFYPEVVYCKFDGSLPEDTGFEIVTHPMSYNYQINKKFFEHFKKIDYLRSYKHSCCGHHIHVSKKGFRNNYHIAKCIVFFAENPYFIEFIAQRGENNFTKHEKKDADPMWKIDHPEDRYSAINTTNRHTIEFRIFKGNLSPERIIKNLQFVKSIIEYTKFRATAKINLQGYLKFINKSKYNELKEFVKGFKIEIRDM